ncbi:MAG: nitroreductase family protein [Desulfomonile tiedjei]|nr:nitroreductase family protein [Desulfomonile tiedjei]
MEAILTRRSIRSYTSEPVSDEAVDQLLKAAMSAPTAASQPWHFIVIRDRSILESIPSFHAHAVMLRSAQVGIAVCGDTTWGELRDRWPLDCAAATENMLISANAMGLGAVWVGIYPVAERIEGLRRLLGIPEHVVPLCVVSLGYAREKKGPANRFREDRIHRDRW